MNSHKVVVGVLSVLFLLVSVGHIQAQSVMLVKDIWPDMGSGVVPFKPPAELNGTLFFKGNDGTTGNELWKSDGTAAGTVIVKDIVPGTIGSEPQELTEVNGTLFFVANDDLHGWEVWKSDGTAEGTMLVKNINKRGIFALPDQLTNFKNMLFFAADDGETGQELWRSDGTTAGTVLVKDIRPGFFGSTPTDLTVVNGTLFLSAFVGTELWKSDGSTEGTVLVKDTFDDRLGSLTAVNGTLFFSGDDSTNGRELWKSDGTTAGTGLVKDINPGPADGIIFGNFADFNGTLYFSADDGTTGQELWKSDGTTAGTVLVKDIDPGPSSSSPSDLANMNGMLYFRANDGATGRELWKSDGTTAGTVLVKDINPGTGSSSPSSFTNINATVYFSADDGTTGWELWQTDGTTAGTVLVEDLNPGSAPSRPNNLLVVNGILLFAADDGVIGQELWKLVSAQPGVTITATPQNPPVTIPPGGGFFDFDVTIVNNMATQFTGNYWNTVTLPNGEEVGPQLGPFNVTIAPGDSFSTTLTMEVPARPPAATYGFNMKVGNFPNNVLDVDSFTFTKTGAPSSAKTTASFSAEDWETGMSNIVTTLADFALMQNYPNPFNPSTTISFSLPEASNVTLAIYNLRGQLIRTLHSGALSAGHHRMVWDGRDSHGVKVASGVYLYRLEAQLILDGSARNFVASRKLVLVQ